MFCEYRQTCNLVCNPIKKLCPNYRRLFFRGVVSSLPKPHPTSVEISSASPKVKGCYYSNLTQNVQAYLLSSIQSHLSIVKVYNFNTAIQAAFEESLPIERVIYIDMAPRYSDITKGVQTIESFVDALVEANKLVFLHTKQDYSNSNYIRC